MLERRYSGFLSPGAHPGFRLDIELVAPGKITVKMTLRCGSRQDVG